MKKNSEKWNYYSDIIKRKTNIFIKNIEEYNKIPKEYYIVSYTGMIHKMIIKSTKYLHTNYGIYIRFNTKIPTKKDILDLKTYALSDILFDKNAIYFNAISDTKMDEYISFDDLMNERNIFYTIEEANKKSIENKNKIEFINNNAKDITYDYLANGYKFLGCQNNWKMSSFDENGNLCNITGKPHKVFKYSEKDYPEYRKCMDLNHIHIEVSKGNTGYENIVSCPICKIYWKYDSSD